MKDLYPSIHLFNELIKSHKIILDELIKDGMEYYKKALKFNQKNKTLDINKIANLDENLIGVYMSKCLLYSTLIIQSIILKDYMNVSSYIDLHDTFYNMIATDQNNMYYSVFLEKVNRDAEMDTDKVIKFFNEHESSLRKAVPELFDNIPKYSSIYIELMNKKADNPHYAEVYDMYLSSALLMAHQTKKNRISSYNSILLENLSDPLNNKYLSFAD